MPLLVAGGQRKEQIMKKSKKPPRQMMVMSALIARAAGATRENPQREEAERIIAGLCDGDEATWERLYRVFQASLHSSCCGGVGQPECFRSLDSAQITEGALLFSDKLIAEVEASETVCNTHHAAHTQRHRQ
jgi:hypothetical protein